jgi:hypothetical protein
MRIRHFLLFLFVAATALSALALDRQFPQNAKRGTMSPAIFPAIVIDGKTRALSVGSRIWNQNNMTELANMLRPGEYLVHYTEDLNGEINRVWILSDVEAGKPPPGSSSN